MIVTSRTQQQQQIGLIWAAMLTTVALYGAVGVLAVGTVNAGSEAEISWPRQLFSACAVILGAVSIWWRRHFLAADPAAAPPLVFTQLQGHGVVTWALSETVGICGLLMALVVHDAREFIPFGAAAAALLLLHRPSNLPWERLAPPPR